MTKVIDLHRPVKEVCEEYPEIVPIMKELGFHRITNPVMLNTVGKVMTIYKGAMMQKIPLDKIKETFQNHGFRVKDSE